MKASDPYSLKAGQLLPTRHTDEGVKGGVYFYGSLAACPKSGLGEVKLRGAGGETYHQVEGFCNSAIISILQVRGVVAGPKKATDAQWAKSGCPPSCACVVGCIVSKAQNDAFHEMIKFDNRAVFSTFAQDMLEIAQNPSKYLPLDSWEFLQRYAAGGVFLAHADWLPTRCIVSGATYDDGRTDESIAGELLKKQVAGFMRDDSFDDPLNEGVLTALKEWVRRGLRQERVVRDPSTDRCYTLVEAGHLPEKTQNTVVMAKGPLYEAYWSAINAVIKGKEAELPRAKCLRGSDEGHVEEGSSGSGIDRAGVERAV